MSICKYCKRNAGWFKDEHASCVQKANEAIKSIKACMADAVMTGKKYSEVSETFNKLASEANLSHTQLHASLVSSWSQAAIEHSKAQPLSYAENDTNVILIMDAEGLTEATFGAAIQAGTANSTILAGMAAETFSTVIWAALNGKEVPPDWTAPQIRGAFNLQPGEYMVWGMPHMLIRQQSTHVSYVGGYNGMSIRVANGLWYRFGGGRGHREEQSELQDIDMGDFLLTNRAIYFGGKQRGVNFRLPYNQIMRFQYYTDAVGVCKSGAKEQIFIPKNTGIPADCGWFLFNVLQALAGGGGKSETSRSAQAKPQFI
jgi:hypothetical protein